MPITRAKSQHPLQVYLRQLTPEGREKLAEECGTTYDYLRKMCGNGGRQPSPALARTIAEKTGLDKAVLRPDIWEPEEQEAAA